MARKQAAGAPPVAIDPGAFAPAGAGPGSAPLDILDLLAMIPVRNGAVRSQVHKGTLILYVPTQRRWWMGPLSLLPGVRFRMEKGHALDRLGEEVWLACDGRRSVEAIVEGFADRHKLRFHEARLSVMAFLRMLAQRNLVALAAGSREEETGEAGSQEARNRR